MLGHDTAFSGEMTKSKIMRGTEGMVEAIRKKSPKSHVFVSTIPPTPRFQKQESTVLIHLNYGIAKAVKKINSHKVTFFPVHRLFLEQSGQTPKGSTYMRIITYPLGVFMDDGLGLSTKACDMINTMVNEYTAEIEGPKPFLQQVYTIHNLPKLRIEMEQEMFPNLVEPIDVSCSMIEYVSQDSLTVNAKKSIVEFKGNNIVKTIFQEAEPLERPREGCDNSQISLVPYDVSDGEEIMEEGEEGQELIDDEIKQVVELYFPDDSLLHSPVKTSTPKKAWQTFSDQDLTVKSLFVSENYDDKIDIITDTSLI